MTIVSRLQLDHPALGAAGGSALHAQIEAIYTKVGNNIGSRYFLVLNLNDTANTDVDHNFRSAFDDLRVELYLYDEGTTELTQLTDDTSPARSAFTVAATPGFLTTKVRVTNNSGAQRDLVVIVQHDPVNLAELENVDLVTAPPEDGQALVYQSSNKKWIAGASGDSSLKIQSVTDPSAVIKGGPGILLDANQILRTYDGAGGASTDYGADLTINLDTLLGGNPANATTYWLYIDLYTLALSPTTLSDSGQKVYGITIANLVITTQDPENTLRDPTRYVPLGFIRSANAGTVWSGTGSAFGTQPFRHHERLAKFFAVPETFVDESVTTAVASTALSHNLSGEPHGVYLTYDDGATEIGLDLSAHLLNVTATQIVVSSLGLTFGGGQKLRVRAMRIPTQPALATSGRQFASGWFQNTATTTLPHGLTDVEDIRSYVVQEWDVTAGRYRLVSETAIVVNYDGTNFYLNWTGVTPSATLQYRIVAGSSPLAFAIPLHYGGFNKFVGIGPGSYATLTAAIAAAAPGDAILVARDTTEPAGDVTVGVAGLRIHFMPNVKVGMSGAMTNGLRLTAAKIRVEGLLLELNPSGAQARGLSIEAADAWVDGKIEKIGAQTVTDGVHVTSGGVRTYGRVAIQVSAGAVTNLLTNNDGASDVNAWGG